MSEKWILYLSWFLIALALWYFVPRDKIRDAWMIFLSEQLLTGVGGLYVAHKQMIEYPVRFFTYANRTSFTFEYFAYPAICVFFNLYYPEKKGWPRRLLHYLLFTSAITGFEVFLELNTDLIRYVTWEWYWTFGSLLVTFYLSRLYYIWFRKRLDKGGAYAD